MINSPAELREHLGMDEGQLLQSPNGAVADILGVANGNVTIGVLDTGQVLTLPLSCFYRENPL